MTQVPLSKGEKTFITHGVEDDFRADGRTRQDYRPMELETGLVSNASGSARLRLANTDILVGVKAEIDKPHEDSPHNGIIEFFVDCSANATPHFEGRGGELLAMDLAETLSKHYKSGDGFDLKTLCILEGQQCWKLYIDILILECGGNLYDAVSLAAKAALYNTRLPVVTAAILDAGEHDLIISDNPYDCTRLEVNNVPILVTMCKVGKSLIVDPSAEEEECGSGSIVIGVYSKATTSGMHVKGNGSLHPLTLSKALPLAKAVGDKLNEKLLVALQKEEEETGGKRVEAVGFLK